MKIQPTSRYFAALLALCFFLAGCDKEDEMVVNREVSPVAVTLTGTSFAANETVKVSATIVELDKSGILNHQVGIVSMPLASLPVSLKVNNVVVATATTNATGVVAFERTWAQLGLAAPKSKDAVTLEWAGTHKGTAFVKAARVTVK